MVGQKWSLQGPLCDQKGSMQESLYADRVEVAHARWTVKRSRQEHLCADRPEVVSAETPVCGHCFSFLPVRVAATSWPCSEGHLDTCLGETCHQEKWRL